MSALLKASPAPRDPGLRANFVPRKEYQAFLSRGRHTFTLPGRSISVTAQVNAASPGQQSSDSSAQQGNENEASNKAVIDEPGVRVSLFWGDSKEDGQQTPFALWTMTDRLVETSQHGLVNQERAAFQHVWSLEIQDENVNRSLWAAIYACTS